MSERQQVAFQGPLHEQVHKVLRDRILGGEWDPLEPLPGEAVLSRELGVSIGTVRRAMDQLTRENMVVRARGRGTFVRRDAEWRSESAFRLRDRAGRTLTPRITILDSSVAPATDGEMSALKLRAMARLSRQLLRLHREWRVEGRLVCDERIVVEAARFPRLREEMDEAAETLFAVYATVYRSIVSRVLWSIGAPPPSDGEQSTCRAALSIQRIALDARGAPLELCNQQIMLADCRALALASTIG